MATTNISSSRIGSLCLVLVCASAVACDTVELPANFELEDQDIALRQASIDCAPWVDGRPVFPQPSGKVDIGFGFALNAFEDGFAGLRACEHTTSYDQLPNGDWVITGAMPGELTWDLGLRNGDRNVKVRGLDSETGEPVGGWVPMAFPNIPAEDLLYLFGCDDFEVKATTVVGTKKFKVHLTD